MTSDSSVNKSDGLPPAQIRAMLVLRDETLEDIGAALGIDPRRLPETIDRKRRNERVRAKLCTYLNLPYEKLWGTDEHSHRSMEGRETAEIVT